MAIGFGPRRVLASVVLPVVAAFTVPLLAAQEVSSSVDLSVPVYVTVTDDEGQLVPDLLEEHFEVYDKGKRQTITSFTSGLQPITVVVMLDMSGSMAAKLDLLHSAAAQFVRRLLPGDRARVGSFSDRIALSSPFISDQDELVRLLRRLPPGNPTRLWDAVNSSMTALAGETGRRVVLVLSDGDDNDSREVDRGDVIKRGHTEGFMVCGIGWRSRYYNGRDWVTTWPDRNLRGLAEETGGSYFELEQNQDLGAAFTRVADELHRQYVLTFSPQEPDGKVHDLEVKVTIPDLKVRARSKYLAPQQGDGPSKTP